MSDADNFFNSFQSFIHLFEICIIRKIKPGYVDLAISSVIRQKGEYRYECFKKTILAKFSKKRTCVYQGEEMFVFWKIWRDLFF